MKSVLIWFGALLILTACRETPPTLSMPEFTGFEVTAATTAADITIHYKGDYGIVEAGVYLGVALDSGRIPAADVEESSFTVHITGLQPSTTYHYKAFLSSGVNEILSPTQVFTTEDPKDDQNVIVNGNSVTVYLGGKRLQESLETHDLLPEKIKSLTLIGNLETEDFIYIREQMKYLENLDLRQTTVTVIPRMAFMGKTWLSEVQFPSGLVKVCDHAFYGSGLESLNLPDSVEEIGMEAFGECERLYGSLEIPKSMKVLEGGAFRACSELTSVKLPEGLQYIGEAAFRECYRLGGELVLPESLTFLGEMAFEGTNFRGDLIIPNNIRTILDATFLNVGFDGRLVLPEGLEEIRQVAFADNHFKGELTLPEGLLSIGEGAFANIGFSGPLNLPASLKRLGESAFSGNCFSGELIIPEAICIIPNGVFSDMEYIQQFSKIILHKDVKSIRGEAFAGGESVKEIVCYNDSPPEAEDNWICIDFIPSITLRVPADAVEKYKEAERWRNFGSIFPIE